MATQTTYEVYVLQAGRWVIHSRFPAAKMDAAIQDAKTQEKINSVTGVKVVKETYDPDQGLSKDTLVYKSPGLTPQMMRLDSASSRDEGAAARPSGSAASRGPARGRAAGPVPSWRESDDEEDDEEEEDDPKPRKPAKVRRPGERGGLGGFVKLALITFFSMGLGVVMTMIGTTFLRTNKLWGLTLTGDMRSNILFAIFVASFLFSIIPLCWVFISMDDFASDPAKRAAKRRARQQAAARPAPVRVEIPTPPPMPVIEIAEIEEIEEPPVAEPEPEPEPEAAPAEEALSPVVERQKVFMMKFLGDSLQKIKASQQSLAGINKFGLDLYLAGACDALAVKNDVDEEGGKQILADTIEVLGYKKEQAISFAEKSAEYLLNDPNCMQIYEAGRNAMNAVLEGDDGGLDTVSAALAEWSKPREKQVRTGPITVMFTDMVGSTALTQAKGDAAAQEVVRAHNRIVRDALQRYGGKEVKHTGDGIMCSFPQTSNGVEAAADIMRKVRDFRDANPDLPLHLKIGINAGEPIAEDDDLFGTTVQLSARICDKAKSGEILVSEIVRGICAGKDIPFTSRGGYEMKGFADPVNLFEVAWAAAAAAAAPAQPAADAAGLKVQAQAAKAS